MQVIFGFVRKAKKVKIRLFGLFKPKSGLFRQKEDQFRSIFSKRSAIRPRSDKADLHGSTEYGGLLGGQQGQQKTDMGLVRGINHDV